MNSRPARLLLVAVALALAACAGAGARRTATAPPALSLPLPKIAPAALAEFAARQQLRVTVRTPPQGAAPPPTVVDALLAVDRDAVHLALLVASRRVIDLRWDGDALTEQRAAQVPAAISSERIVRDVLFVYAPLDALRAALPSGDRVEEGVGSDGLRERRWSRAGTLQLAARYHADPAWAGALDLDNLAEGYLLAIDSQPLPTEAR